MLIESHRMPHRQLMNYKENNLSKKTSTRKEKSLVEEKDIKNKDKELKNFLEPELISDFEDDDKSQLFDSTLMQNDEEYTDFDTNNEDDFEDTLEDTDDFSTDLSTDLSSLSSFNSDLDDDLTINTFEDEYPLQALPKRNKNNLPQVSKPRLPNVFSKDNLNLYLSEISAFPMLKPEEELEYARRVRDENDPDAAFRLVSSHLRLVVRIAMEFQRRWMQNVLDLIQEGNIGLLRAVNKFDADKGIKFSYYATFWIRAYILKFIMDNWRMVKIGTTQAQRKLFYNLNKEKQKLIAQGFDPDIEILSDKLGVSKEHIIEMEQRLESTDLSLDMPVGDENNASTRLDYLPALTQGVEEGFAESEINEIIHAKLEALLPKLSDKEIFILENRLLTDNPVTLREIGEKYEVTRERIRQLEARLVNKMKNYLSAEIEDFSEDWIQQ